MVPRDELRDEVLDFVRKQSTPVRMSSMADALRKQNPQKMRTLRDSEVRDIVQPMIVTGKLSYAPGLKIQLGPKKK